MLSSEHITTGVTTSLELPIIAFSWASNDRTKRRVAIEGIYSSFELLEITIITQTNEIIIK